MVKIERTQPEPPELTEERLKDGGEYNIPAVNKQLYKDFHKKCYICGKPVVSEGYEIEHLKPHDRGKKRDLKFDWNNLFLSCCHCNSVKNCNQFKTNIIDCCSEDPEKLIRQEIFRGRITACARKTAPNQETAENTAKLITECYNSKTTYQREISSESKRRELKAMAISLCKKLRHYRQLRDCENRNETEFKVAETEVLNMISKRSAYAGFLRTLVRDRLDMFPEFEKIVKVDPERGT